jgi:hypothetical protein
MASCIKQALKFIAVTVLFMPAAVNAQYEYIDINKPFLRKIPMAIPVFVSLSEPAVDQQELRHAADLLADMLAFTGYFKMLDRGPAPGWQTLPRNCSGYAPDYPPLLRYGDLSANRQPGSF